MKEDDVLAVINGHAGAKPATAAAKKPAAAIVTKKRR